MYVRSRRGGRLKWGELNVCASACVCSLCKIYAHECARRRTVCVCVYVWGAVGSLIHWKCSVCMCVCARWIRGAGAGLWACKILPQLWLLALPVCLTRTGTNTHRHTSTQACTDMHANLYLGVTFTLQTECRALLFMPFSVNRWVCGDMSGSFWTVQTRLLGKKKKKDGRFYVILSEAHESSIDFVLFPLNFKVRVSVAHL